MEGFSVNYIPPFELIRGRLTLSNIRGKLTATSDYEEMTEIVKLLLSGVQIDETWYLQQNPDIAEAIEAGQVKSARHHFIHNGYFEGRRPFPIVVDEAWYLTEYPEIADAIGRGLIESAQRHFDDHGYSEGRRPRSYA